MFATYQNCCHVLFNSLEFLLFLPVVFFLYWFVANKRLQWQNILILVASYFFYGWWSWKFMCLLLLSTFLDYAYGFGVAAANKHKAKLFLWLSVINNLGILAVFKYYNFFATELAALLHHVGLHTTPVLLQLALPVGISFYTFHGMSYVFDIYKGRQQPVRSFTDYAVFVSFFPLLVAGPIERASHLLPQVQRARIFNYAQAIAGCRLMLWGFFKKVVVADSLAPKVDGIFATASVQDPATLILGAVAFSFQIYGDFSGYSDIALGTAKLFGFELLSNFKFPYFSRDIAEFWRRWHISLSSWFRDYLYIPLGGSKEGKAKAIRNTFIIFLVSGFWHGANWTFIVWGGIHACGFLPLLLLNRNRKNVTDVVAQHRKWPDGKELLQMLGTFAFATLAWIFFRADTLQIAYVYIRRMVGGIVLRPASLLHMPNDWTVIWFILPMVVGDWILRRNERAYNWPLKPALRIVLYFVLAVTICIFWGANTNFIYFQF